MHPPPLPRRPLSARGAQGKGGGGAGGKASKDVSGHVISARVSGAPQPAGLEDGCGVSLFATGGRGDCMGGGQGEMQTMVTGARGVGEVGVGEATRKKASSALELLLDLRGLEMGEGGEAGGDGQGGEEAEGGGGRVGKDRVRAQTHRGIGMGRGADAQASEMAATRAGCAWIAARVCARTRACVRACVRV